MKIISYKLGPSEVMGNTDRGSKERADSEAARELADVNLDWACPESLGLSLGSQVLVRCNRPSNSNRQDSTSLMSSSSSIGLFFQIHFTRVAARVQLADAEYLSFTF